MNDCWDCRVAWEDGEENCIVHRDRAVPLDLGMAMLWASLGVDPQSSFSGEYEGDTTMPLVLPVS